MIAITPSLSDLRDAAASSYASLLAMVDRKWPGATRREPVLKEPTTIHKLEHVLNLMRGARNADCMMLVWKSDISAVEEALKALKDAPPATQTNC